MRHYRKTKLFRLRRWLCRASMHVPPKHTDLSWIPKMHIEPDVVALCVCNPRIPGSRWEVEPEADQEGCGRKVERGPTGHRGCPFSDLRICHMNPCECELALARLLMHAHTRALSECVVDMNKAMSRTPVPQIHGTGKALWLMLMV